MFFKVFNVFHIFQNLGSSFFKMLVSRVDFKSCKNHKMLVSRAFHVFHIFQAFIKCWFQVLISKGVKFTKCWFQVFHGFSKMLVSSVDFERRKLHKCWFQGFLHQNVEFTKCFILWNFSIFISSHHHPHYFSSYTKFLVFEAFPKC